MGRGCDPMVPTTGRTGAAHILVNIFSCAFASLKHTPISSCKHRLHFPEKADFRVREGDLVAHNLTQQLKRRMIQANTFRHKVIIHAFGGNHQEDNFPNKDVVFFYTICL